MHYRKNCAPWRAAAWHDNCLRIKRTTWCIKIFSKIFAKRLDFVWWFAIMNSYKRNTKGNKMLKTILMTMIYGPVLVYTVGFMMMMAK